MIRNSNFWIRLFLVGAAVLAFGSTLGAQASTRTSADVITFETLPRARRVESTARPSPRKDLSTPLRDSIARLNTLLSIASSRPSALGARRPTDTIPAPAAKDSAPAPRKVDTEFVALPQPKPAPATQLPFAAPTVSGLFQLMLSGGDSALKSTYRIRRAELKLTSDLGRRATATVMIDVSKALAVTSSATSTSVTQSSRALQDAFLSVPVWTIQIDAGQQRLPLGYEGSHSSSTLETIDRALMESDRARGASFGDVRDVGAAVKGKWRGLDYRAGVFNGSGESMNETDRNTGKAVVGQLALRPAQIKGLRFGGSGTTSGAATGDKPARDRVGVDLVYQRGIAHLQAEAMRGQDGPITRYGMYVLTGLNARKNLKLVARFDAWDPNTRAETTPADVTERDYLAGFTWFPSGTRLKAQFAVVRKTYTHAITPSATLAQTQLQASW